MSPILKGIKFDTTVMVKFEGFPFKECIVWGWFDIMTPIKTGEFWEGQFFKRLSGRVICQASRHCQ